MKRKILLLLTTLITMSGMLNISAIAAEQTDSAEQSKSLGFAQAMGIISYGKNDDDTITRAELAQSYQYIITNGREEDTNTPTKFTDVFGSSAINLVSSMGIMTGYDEKTFAPTEPVTYIQLMTTMVKFLGYDELAVNAGGYPNGYLNLGIQLDLMVDGFQLEDAITAEKAGEMFWKASEVGLMRNISAGDKKSYEISDNQTYLSLYLHITPVNGIINSNSTTSLRGKKYLELNQVELNDEIYYVDNRMLSIKDKIGYNVETYVKKISDDEYYIIYYEEKNNDVIQVVDIDVKNVTQNRISYYENLNKTAHIEFNNSTYVIYNGSLCTSYDESILNPFAGTTKDGYLRAVDNNRDGICDILFVSAYDSYVVESVLDGVIFNKFKSSELLNIGDFREGEIEIVNVLGETIKFEEIAKDDVICVEKNIAGEVKKITVVIDRFVGSITQFDSLSSEIVLGSTQYEMSNSMMNSTDHDILKVGISAQFYFNRDGKICAVDFEGYDDYNLAYLTNLYPLEEHGEQNGYTAKIFTKSGIFVKYALAEKITIGDSKVNDENAASLLGGTGAATVRQVIKYRVNDKNEIIYLELCDMTNDGTHDGLYQYQGFDGVSSRPVYKSGMGSFGAQLLINSGTIIMEVPTQEYRDDEELYSVKTTSYFRNDSSAELFSAYGTKKNTAVAEIVIRENDAVQQISSYSNIVVVDKIVDGVNSENEPVKVLHGLVNGKLEEVIAKADALKIRPEKYPAPADSSQQTYTYPQKGDAIMISQDRNGEINYAKYVFDYERESIYHNSSIPVANNRTSNPSGAFNAEYRFLYGKVMCNDDNNITLEITSYDGNVTYEHYPVSKFLLMKYDADEGREGMLSSASYADIRSSETYPGYESKVIVQLRYGDAKCMVIYNGGGTE
ncbi:MAG: S-layer homology domain-containing protein [Clostridia bacterium]|nr:S-layer homology domain-containing protein [Clostridia bacterium]